MRCVHCNNHCVLLISCFLCAQGAQRVVALNKIWLFNNRLTDRGARHVARMLSDTVTEVR